MRAHGHAPAPTPTPALTSKISRASLVRRRRGYNDDTKGWSIGFEVAEKFDSNGW